MPSRPSRIVHRVRLKNSAPLALLLLLSGQAMALDSDLTGADDFIEACRQLSVAAASGDESEAVRRDNICLAYIDGFFAGTDEVLFQEELPSAYALRVLRTRGRRLGDYHQKLLNSPYCVPEDESIISFAGKVASTDKEFPETAGASDVIKFVLEQYFSCDRN